MRFILVMLQDNENEIYLFMCLFMFVLPYPPPERIVVNEKILENFQSRSDDVLNILVRQSYQVWNLGGVLHTAFPLAV